MDDLLDFLKVQLEKSHYAALRSQDAGALAEVESKLALLAWLDRIHGWAIDNNLWSYDAEEPLKILAAPYADQEGYREEWKL